MKKRLAVLAAAVSAVALFGGMATAGADFGQFVQVLGLRVGGSGHNGQGSQYALGSWVEVPAAADPDLRTQAVPLGLQPGRGNWVIHEDADTNTALQGPHNNDLWDCLPDGTDPDLQSDGCIRIATLNDLTAEWTGGIFDASGTHFYVSVQHNITGKGVILDITGWS